MRFLYECGAFIVTTRSPPAVARTFDRGRQVRGDVSIASAAYLACFALLLSACTSMQRGESAATANVRPASGSQTTGTVKFTQVSSRVRVDAQLNSLTPGSHGFHIHEKGDCSAPDATSAGGHFNPYATKHGAPGAPESHLGDLGNLTADASGKATLTLWLDGISVSTGKNGVIDRAVVVHAGPDDLKTDPTGNSGGRIACGVIKL